MNMDDFKWYHIPLLLVMIPLWKLRELIVRLLGDR